MASSLSTILYICDQIQSLGDVTYKKMFGEYMIYFNEKPIFLVCDDILYIKIAPQTKGFLGEKCDTGYPYSGAKPHFIIDFLDDKGEMQTLAKLLESITSYPKRRKNEI